MKLSRAKIWLLAIRPATLGAAVGPVVVGTALAAADQLMHVGAALCALLGALLIQIGTNLYNDYADFDKGADTDERVGPARATAKGWLKATETRNAAYFSFFLAACSGVYLVVLAGWPVVAIGIASIVSGLLYTGGPAPLAYRGLGDVFVWVFFGVVAVCGTYYVQAQTLTPTIVLCSVAVGAWSTAILVVNNLRDRHTDEMAQKRTLVVRFGARFGRFEYAGLLALAYGVPLVLCFLTWQAEQAHIGWLLPIITVPLAVKQLRRVFVLDGEALNAELGGTARMGLLFNALLAVGIFL